MLKKSVSVLIIFILLLFGPCIIPVSGEDVIKPGTNDYNEKENWVVIISGGMNEPISESFIPTARRAYQTLKKIGYEMKIIIQNQFFRFITYFSRLDQFWARGEHALTF